MASSGEKPTPGVLRPPARTEIFAVRLRPGEAEALHSVARRRQVTASVLIRQYIAYLIKPIYPPPSP